MKDGERQRGAVPGAVVVPLPVVVGIDVVVGVGVPGSSACTSTAKDKTVRESRRATKRVSNG